MTHSCAAIRHTVTDCDPSNYARVHRKPRCPVLGCKEKLTAANTYCCKDCRLDVCLKHRFAKDHRCSGKPGRQRLPLNGSRIVWYMPVVLKIPAYSACHDYGRPGTSVHAVTASFDRLGLPG